jgi:hypothetical protein
MGASLCTAANIVASASQITFTDQWHDTLTGNSANGYGASTTGSFSASVSLPLDGVDLSKADSGTQFSLNIGPAGGAAQIISGTLGDAENYAAGAIRAKFPILDPNTSASIGTVTVSWTATTITVTGSASEDILGEEAQFSSESDDSPTNYTLNSTITGVLYEVSVTLDASDNGGGTFHYDNASIPVTGKDTESDPNPDGNGPYPLESGSVTGTGVFTPPTLTITSPAPDFKIYNLNSVIELEGRASDSTGLTNVEYYVNGDINTLTETDQFPGDSPTNSVAWTASVDFSLVGQVGSNVVTVVATDSEGNEAEVSRTFVWIQTNSAILTISPTAAGKVKGITNGQVLQIGKSYSVTATPAGKDWIFSDWTDVSNDIISSNVTFQYVDTDGTLTANFVPNPFTNADLAGTYRALYYDTNDESVVRDDGYMIVTVTGTGAFTGQIYNADYSKTTGSLSGQLSEAPDGSFATATPPLVLFGRHDYLQVNLRIATDPVLTDPGAGSMTGFVNSFDNAAATNVTDSAQIMGKLSIYNTNIVAGPYNIVIAPVSIDPSQGPGGYSYGTATVSKKGTVAVVLHLADDASPTISFSSALAQDGSCPIYAALYGGNAALLGWMRFATDGSGSMSPATITWFTETYDNTILPHGIAFSGQPLLSGGLYLPPKAGTNLFGEGQTALTFEIDPGYSSSLSLPNEIDVPVTFSPAKNTFSDADKVSITLTATTGALTGTFYPAASKSSITYHGVVVDGAGYGFYTDKANSETGPIWLGVHP